MIQLGRFFIPGHTVLTTVVGGDVLADLGAGGEDDAMATVDATYRAISDQEQGASCPTTTLATDEEAITGVVGSTRPFRGSEGSSGDDSAQAQLQMSSRRIEAAR